MESIKEVLMKRDGHSSYDADEIISEAVEELERVLADGGDIFDAEDLVLEYFGLEPDYLMEILPEEYL